METIQENELMNEFDNHNSSTVEDDSEDISWILDRLPAQAISYIENKHYDLQKFKKALNDNSSKLSKMISPGFRLYLLTQLTPTKKPITICDNVWGTIQLHPLADAFRMSKEFGRMRDISQLGTVDYVYPGAVGNRYSHSIGTYHVTRMLLEKLRDNNQTALRIVGIKRKDFLIVELAALLHDIGHGPWSHFWDDSMIPSQMKQFEKKDDATGKVIKYEGIRHPYRDEYITKWSHEDASKAIVRHILKTNILVQKAWEEAGLDEKDILFLIELINPTALQGLEETSHWPMKGRPESHAFLYEIVSNKKGGIDTDRMDYLERDSFMCKGKKNQLDYHRIFINIHVRTCKNNEFRTLLCYDKKIGEECLSLLLQRDRNHRELYQHPKALATCLQLEAALKLAHESFKQKGSDGRWYSPVESIFDMTAYVRFTEPYMKSRMTHPDEIIDLIESQPCGNGELAERNRKINNLRQAAAIMNDLEERRFWTLIGTAKFPNKESSDELYENRNDFILKFAETINKLPAIKKRNFSCSPDDFHVYNGPKYNMGKKDEDPLKYLPMVEEGVSGYVEGKSQEFFRTTYKFGSEYCVSFLTTNESYINEAKMILARMLKEKNINHDHISEDFALTPDSRRTKRPCSPSMFEAARSRRKLTYEPEN